MESFNRRLLETLVIAAVSLTSSLRAQTNDQTIQAGYFTVPLAQLQLVSPDSVPESGNFWMVSVCQQWGADALPYPFNTHPEAPVYSWGIDGLFLVDDTSVSAAATVGRLNESNFATSQASTDGMGFGELDSSSQVFGQDDLWLELAGVANGTVSLTVHPPAAETTDCVYDLFATTNLAAASWQWVMCSDPGQTNLVVPNLTGNQSFFILGRTNDADSDGMSDAFESLVSHTDPNNGDQNGNGIPDGWEWSYFGSLQPGNGDYDGDNVSNYEEYLNGTDPNKIKFSAGVTNRYVNINPVPVQITVSNGVPASMAVLVDSTNFAAATWLPYPTAVNVTNEGWHDVFIGLRGRLITSQQTWQWIRFNLDTTPPSLSITNPVSSTVMQPMIEVQGFCPEPLASLSYDLTNAAGIFTNQQAFVVGQFYDTNTAQYTTNWFQAFDVGLTNGLNTFTFQAMDLAGNVTTTNFTYILDYAAKTNPPMIQLYWPQDGTQISGTNSYTWRGWVDDFTATVTATLVGTNGNTNIYTAVVERDGNFWVENLPAPLGSSLLQLTTTDVMGNVTVTNITVNSSAVAITIHPPQVSADQIYCTVNGTINSSGYTVWVNGVQAQLNGGAWTAVNVPITPGGTAVFHATAVPNSGNGANRAGANGTRILAESANSGENDFRGATDAPDSGSSPGPDAEIQNDKPSSVYLASYHYNDSMYEEDYYPRFLETDIESEIANLDWRNDSGASQHTFDHWYGSTPSGEYTESTTTDASWPAPSSNPYFGTVIVNNDGVVYTYIYGAAPNVLPEYWQDTFLVNARNGDEEISVIQSTWNEHAELKLFTGGKGVPGQLSLFRISASASKMPGQIPIDPQDVHVLGFSGNGGWISLPNNVTMSVTPTANANHYQFGVSAAKYTPYITANGIDLRGNTPEFCVGQSVTFRLEGLPAYLDIVSRWNLPGNFVNESFQYSSTCTSYRINDALLANSNPTSCWFVNGSGGGVSIGASLRFGDGTTIGTAAKGTIIIYRPSVSLRDCDPDRYYTISLDTGLTCKLKLGKDDQSGSGTMSFDVNLKSKTAGSIGITQLITANYSNPFYVFSNERCDGLEYYSGPTPVSGSTNSDVVTGVVGLGDGPWSIWADPNRVSLSCRDFVRFAPNGGIPVTLGILQWHTVGLAQRFAGGWIILEDHDTPDPTGPDKSDEFPRWMINQGDMH